MGTLSEQGGTKAMRRVVDISEVLPLEAYKTFADGMQWVPGDLQRVPIVRDQNPAIFFANSTNRGNPLTLQNLASLASAEVTWFLSDSLPADFVEPVISR
jgi:hypothetical protein